MDWNRVEGNWKQFRGKVKEKWGDLTDDDLDVINGRRDQLEGRLQERYGYAKDQARKDVDAISAGVLSHIETAVGALMLGERQAHRLVVRPQSALALAGC
jgi:uncharacterized protein YjbJ (UPF0337 family)